MIKRLYADNYRCFVNFELHLEEMSLLLGRNGAGKSSVLDIVFAVRELLSGRTPVTGVSAFPPSTLTRWQSRRVQAFELDVDLNDSTFVYRLEVEHDKVQQRARIQLERLTEQGDLLFNFEAGQVQLYRDDLSEGPGFPSDWTVSSLARVAPGKDNTRLVSFQNFMRRVIVCSLYPRAFAPESATEDEVLQRDGRNFAGWYRHMSQERPDLIAEYTETMKSVLDGFRGIRMEKVGLDTRALIMVFREGSEDYQLRFDEVSDGQRALTALHALKSALRGCVWKQAASGVRSSPSRWK